MFGVVGVDSFYAVTQHCGRKVEVKDTRASDRMLLKQTSDIIMDRRSWIDFSDVSRVDVFFYLCHCYCGFKGMGDAARTGDYSKVFIEDLRGNAK